nr:Ldh family oxidoreductase [Sphingomonadaceae bacterium]
GKFCPIDQGHDEPAWEKNRRVEFKVVTSDGKPTGAQLGCDEARQHGIAALAIRNSHHFAALWPDVEPFADAGLVAIAFVNSRSRIVPAGGNAKLFGTNPMAFACPRRDGPPMIWDQASSVMAHGEILLAAKEGHSVPEGIGVDAAGKATTDPKAILEGGALLPFAGHKGSTIALMVEIMASALTGGRFGFEDTSSAFPGAQTTNAGEFVIVIDPRQTAGSRFYERIEELFSRLLQSGETRLPAERRYRARRLAEAQGIAIATESFEELVKLRESQRPP